jgi:dTDP-4-amino-4,6-dideoxygalactose transaminase
MLEIQAAIGRYQIKKMESWNLQRSYNAQFILNAVKSYKLVRVAEFKCNKSCNKECFMENDCKHAYYKCYLYIEPKYLRKSWSRDRIIDEIKARNIPCFQGSCSEVYLEKAFDGTDFRPIKQLSIAKELGETSLMFLVHPSLTKENLDASVSIICEVLDQATEQ